MPGRRRAGQAWSSNNIPEVVDGTVTVGANSIVSAITYGWTFTHQEQSSDINATTKGWLGDVAKILNQHLIGFGTVELMPSVGEGSGGPVTWATWDGTYDWDGLDERLGYKGSTPTGPTDFSGQANGWMSTIPSGQCCLTACGCPKWMRHDPAGTYIDGPITDIENPAFNRWKFGVPSAEDRQTTARYQPPWVGRIDDYVDLIILALKRYPHVGIVQVWNEMKNHHSDLLNRWDYEYYTVLYNRIWDGVQAEIALGNIRADLKIGGPYPVFTTYAWDASGRWASTANSGGDPLKVLEGPWGYADKRVLDVVKYWTQHAHGADYLMLDIRQNNKDYEAKDYRPILASAAKDWPWYSTTPPKSYHWPVDAWAAPEKQVAIRNWLTLCATTSPTLYGASNAINLATIPLWWSEWYANPMNEVTLVPGDLTPESSLQEMLSVEAWSMIIATEIGTAVLLKWRLEGGENDDLRPPPDTFSDDKADPIALWRRSDRSSTILLPMMTFLNDHFSSGTQLKTVTSTHPDIRAMASATHIFAVSKSATPITLTVDGDVLTFSAYEVKMIVR